VLGADVDWRGHAWVAWRAWIWSRRKQASWRKRGM
jgi:hypothetical protein